MNIEPEAKAALRAVHAAFGDKGMTAEINNNIMLSSIAISLYRIANSIDPTEGSPKGSILYWFEMLASAVNSRS